MIEAAQTIDTTEESGEQLGGFSSYEATYSPEDNKLRLYSVHRLPAELYAQVKKLGFIWAPKQDLFVAPMWTPQREDFLTELCGEIGDETKSLAERQAERAERFGDYSTRRGAEANRAREAVSAIASRFEFGQPILVGHHSERKARKDAERMQNNMHKAVNLWETADYWKGRAVGALAHASYKEDAGVRHRRFKGIEADKRKAMKNVQESEKALQLWSADGLTMERALLISGYGHISRCFLLKDYPREAPASQYEGPMSIYSALDGGIINETQAKEISIKAHTRVIAWNRRWIAHYDNRLTFERTMLGEGGGIAASKFDIQPGGRVLVRGEWLVVLRVNRKDGQALSVSTNSRYVSVKGIEEVQDYQAPTEEDAAKVKARKALAPLVNFQMEGVKHMTNAEYMAYHTDYRGTKTKQATETQGAYRFRCLWSGGKVSPVFLTDKKEVQPPALAADGAASPVGRAVTFERVMEVRKPATQTAEALAAAEQAKAEENSFKDLRDAAKAGVKVLVAPQLFPTPELVAAEMVELADVQPGDDIAEPSAGTGRLIQAVADAVGLDSVKLTAVELFGELSRALGAKFPGIRNVCGDFLECGSELGLFDVILMNPPFENARDIAHIQHAMAMLKPGGRLVAVCAGGPRQAEKLKPLAEASGGIWRPLPAGTFKESGTGVHSVLMTYRNDRG